MARNRPEWAAPACQPRLSWRARTPVNAHIATEDPRTERPHRITVRSTQVAPTRIDNRKVAIDHLGKRFLPPRASAEAGEIAKDYPVECKEREAEIATEISLAENVMHALAIGYHVKTAAAIIDSAVRTGAHGSIPHDPRQRIGAARRVPLSWCRLQSLRERVSAERLPGQLRA